MFQVLFYQCSCTFLFIFFYSGIQNSRQRNAAIAVVNSGGRKPGKVNVTEVGCKEGNLKKKSIKVRQQYLIRIYKPGLDLKAPTEQAAQWSKTGLPNNLSSKSAKRKE